MSGNEVTRTEMGYAYWKEIPSRVAEARVQAKGRIAWRQIIAPIDKLINRLRAALTGEATEEKMWLCAVCGQTIRKHSNPTLGGDHYEHSTGFGIRSHFAVRPDGDS